jgi:hypothetical protein
VRAQDAALAASDEAVIAEGPVVEFAEGAVDESLFDMGDMEGELDDLDDLDEEEDEGGGGE